MAAHRGVFGPTQSGTTDSDYEVCEGRMQTVSQLANAGSRLKPFDASGRHRLTCQPSSRTGENPLYGSATRKKQVCSVGGRPTEAKVRSLVAWIAGRREIEFPKPIDKAIFQDGEQVIGP